MHPSLRPLLLALSLAACASPPSRTSVAISPTLFAEPTAGEASTAPVAAPRTGQAPTTALDPLSLEISSAHVPVAASDGARVGAFVERAGHFEAAVTDGGDAFKWIVDKAPRHPLALVAIEERGRRIEPMAGAILSEGGVVATRPPKVRAMRAIGRKLRVEIQGTPTEELVLELEPVGRALRIDVVGGGVASNDVLPLRISQGGVDGDLARTRVLRVPFFDLGGVAALTTHEQKLRFLTTWFDPARSNASYLIGHRPGEAAPGGELHFAQMAQYDPLTNGRRLPLAERIWISYATELEGALPSMERAPAPGVELAADQFLISLSEPDFGAATEALERIAAQGVGWRDLGVAIWMHQWQRDGYDKGYPNAVMPPNPKWGGTRGLEAVRAVCARAGYLFGLHHNWLFNGVRLEGESMLDSNGAPITSDEGGHYLKLRAAEALVDEVEGELHDAFETQGTYSDSIAASLPRADADASVEGAGTMRASFKALGHVIERLRAIHGAPTGSEGSFGFGNVVWSGAFDLVHASIYWQTQPASLDLAGRFADALPHFAWGRLHGLTVRAGVGMPTRYMIPAGTDTPGYTARDRDEQQTMAHVFGSTGYHWWYRLSVPGDVARAWWSSAPIASALADPGRAAPAITYENVKGRERDLDAMLTSDASLARGDVRLKLEWKGPDHVFANLTDEAWREGGLRIAPMGYAVRTGDYHAALVVERGQVSEWLVGPDWRFVDGRGALASKAGLTTDGAVGARLEDGAWRVFPLEAYTLSLPALDAPETVEWTRFELDASLAGGSEVDVEWFDDLGLALETERRAGLPLVFTRAEFEARGASSIRVRPRP